MRDCNSAINAGKYLKPYQGLKQQVTNLTTHPQGRKIPKTLSGIETQSNDCSILRGDAGKYLKPYQGLKRNGCATNLKISAPSRKIPKTLSGIETRRRQLCSSTQPSRKIPKTLSGIETNLRARLGFQQREPAGKYLKPYQGLKRRH